MLDLLKGIGIMIGLFVAVTFLMFGVPALFKQLDSAIFEIRKRIYESTHPGYTLSKFLFGVERPYKIESYKLIALDDPKHYVLVYADELKFVCIPGQYNWKIYLNAGELAHSLKTWKAWNPMRNGLKVETSQSSKGPTFKLSYTDTDTRFKQSPDVYFMEILQKDFIETLEKHRNCE